MCCPVYMVVCPLAAYRLIVGMVRACVKVLNQPIIIEWLKYYLISVGEIYATNVSV